MNQNTKTPTPAINDLNGLAGLFAAAVKNYNFGDDTDMEILERHSGLLETFMGRIGAHNTIGIHQSIKRLVRCYNQHTTDLQSVQDDVMDSIEDALLICHILAQYSNLIHEWEAVFSSMSKMVGNTNNDQGDE